MELRGFGAFSVKVRPSRMGRNPRTGEPVAVEEKRAPFFRTGKELRERLNGNGKASNGAARSGCACLHCRDVFEMSVARFANPVFVALDTPDVSRALAIARAVKPHVGGLKVGLEFISALGPDAVRRIVEIGLPVFADTKFHDIPNTVAGAARAIAMLGVRMFNLHASGGEAMMRAAAEAIADVHPRPLLIAVTVLTSLDDAALASVGQRGPSAAQVERLASLAKTSGLDGVVCSAHEIAAGAQGLRPGFSDRGSRHPSVRQHLRGSAPGDDAGRSPRRRGRRPGHRAADHRRCGPRQGRPVHRPRARQNNSLSNPAAFA